jgi:hypothetical protein
MTLIVKMIDSSHLTSSVITYVQIIPSPIQVNLIQFGPSMIIRGQQQTLILNPGTFSIDPDETYFDLTVSFMYFKVNLLFAYLELELHILLRN